MVLGDVKAPGLSREFWHQWFSSEGTGILLCPMPGTDTFQLQAAPETDERGALLPPSLESFQRLFERHARMPEIRLADPTWLSSWRVNVRMATRIREGRAFLAGDAAHVHPIAAWAGHEHRHPGRGRPRPVAGHRPHRPGRGGSARRVPGGASRGRHRTPRRHGAALRASPGSRPRTRPRHGGRPGLTRGPPLTRADIRPGPHLTRSDSGWVRL